ncbi:MAG: hypothetical protein ACI8QD_000809 [Cyclobacteriaceae bacterium]|jgi:hypothetical protein
MRALVFVLMLLFQLVAFSQDRVSQYLNSVEEGRHWKAVTEQQNFLGKASFKSPLVREFDLRIVTDELAQTIDDYRLRIGLMNPGEIKANKAYNSQYQRVFEQKTMALKNVLLAEKYRKLIDMISAVEQVRLRDEFVGQLSELTELYGASLGIKDAIKLDEKLLQQEILLIEGQSQLQAIKLTIGVQIEELQSIVWSDLPLVTVEDMVVELDRLDEEASSTRFDLLAAKLALNEAALRLEKAQSRRNLGFIQPEFSPGDNGSFTELVGLQIGINIPLVNTDKPKLAYETLDKIEDDYDKQASVEIDELNSQLLRVSFDQSRVKYTQYTEKLLQLKGLLTATSTVEFDESYGYLSYVTQVKIEAHQAYCEMMEDFVSILAARQVLSGLPMRNYLYTSFPAL